MTRLNFEEVSKPNIENNSGTSLSVPNSGGALGNSFLEISRELVRIATSTLEQAVDEPIKSSNRTNPSPIATAYSYNELKLMGYEPVRVEPENSLLVYRAGKFLERVDEGQFKPDLFGNTDIVEIYMRDIQHTIDFPLLLKKSQRKFPSTIRMTYRIEDPRLCYEERCTDIDFLKGLVFSSFGGDLFLLRGERLISKASNKDMNEELFESVGKEFDSKGIGLKKIEILVSLPESSRKLQGVRRYIGEVQLTALEISKLEADMQVADLENRTRVLEAQQRYKQKKKIFEQSLDVTALEGDIQVGGMTHDFNERKRVNKALHDVEINDIYYESREKMMKSAQGFLRDLEDIATQGDDEILRLSLVRHLSAIHKFALIGEYDGSTGDKELSRLIDQEFGKRKKEYKDESYKARHPEVVEIARALSSIPGRLNVQVGEETLKEMADQFVKLYRSFSRGEKLGDEDSGETINSSSVGETITR